MAFLGIKTRIWNKQTAADGDLIDAEVNQIYSDLNELENSKLSYIPDGYVTPSMLADSIKPSRPYSLLFTPEDITLSAVDPYFDISSLDQTITAAQFPELAPKMRAKKARVNVSGTKYNSFTVGATYTANGSSVILKLANNAQNIALLTAMAEAKAYFSTGLSLGVIHLDVTVGNIPAGDYGITDVDSAGLTITFASTAAVGTPSGSETIAIYPHRIAGNATDAKHYMLSEIGFMLHGGAIADGYPVRDQMQGHWHEITVSDDNTAAGGDQRVGQLGSYRSDRVRKAISDGTHGEPRIGYKTRGPALGINVYYYCGTYIP